MEFGPYTHTGNGSWPPGGLWYPTDQAASGSRLAGTSLGRIMALVVVTKTSALGGGSTGVGGAAPEGVASASVAPSAAARNAATRVVDFMAAPWS